MEETETADSHVIHSLHAPSVQGGLYGLPYNPILYPPYGYPGYPDIRTPSYDAAHDGDIHVSKTDKPEVLAGQVIGFGTEELMCLAFFEITSCHIHHTICYAAMMSL